MDTKDIEFGDIATFKYGKMPPKTILKENGKYPVFSGYRYVGRCDEYNLNANMLVIVARGVGGTGDVKITKERCFLTNLSIGVELNQDIALPEYLYYYFLLNNLRWLDSGSAQSQITITDLEKVILPIPTIDDQKKIISFLQVLDQKIKLNESINQNLEQQTRTIFESWCIPVDSSNEVPSSWKSVLLGEIADISNGKRPPDRSATKTEKTPYPLIGAASVMGFTSDYNYSKKILVTGRVGTHGVIQRFDKPCWASDNTLVITSPFYEFVYQCLQRVDYTSLNRGSTQPLITQSDLKKTPLVLPNEKTLASFENIAEILMQKVQENEAENEMLASIRDVLLPKLMSGELDVSNIDIKLDR